jgi:hypothetical protein
MVSNNRQYSLSLSLCGSRICGYTLGIFSSKKKKDKNPNQSTKQNSFEVLVRISIRVIII